MPVKWSMKRKIGESWQDIPLAEVAGKSLRELLQAQIDQDVVAEFVIHGTLNYFCGTDHWKQRMKKKGKACLFSEAIEILQRIKPALLDEIVPGYDVEEVFPGSRISTIEYAAAAGDVQEALL